MNLRQLRQRRRGCGRLGEVIQPLFPRFLFVALGCPEQPIASMRRSSYPGPGSAFTPGGGFEGIFEARAGRARVVILLVMLG